MKFKLSTNICILLTGVMISASIIISSDISKSSNWKLTRSLSNIDSSLSEINSTLDAQSKVFESTKKLSPLDFDKSSYDFLLAKCLKVSTTGFSEYDTTRNRLCMNQLLNINIK